MYPGYDNCCDCVSFPDECVIFCVGTLKFHKNVLKSREQWFIAQLEDENYIKIEIVIIENS